MSIPFAKSRFHLIVRMRRDFGALVRLFMVREFGKAHMDSVQKCADMECRGPNRPVSRSMFQVDGTGWSHGLKVVGGGRGIVSHASLVLRGIADRADRRKWLLRVQHPRRHTRTIGASTVLSADFRTATSALAMLD